MKQLYWLPLPIHARIAFKISLLMYHIHSGTVVFLWCEACAYTGRYTDAFYRKQRLDRVLDSLHFRSYSVGFYYSFLAYVFPYFQYIPPLTLGRIYTPFTYGSTYDLQRSKTYFFLFFFFHRRIYKPTISPI